MEIVSTRVVVFLIIKYVLNNFKNSGFYFDFSLRSF